MKHLASILVRPGEIDILEVETPRPAYGELLIKIKAALTCGTDLKAFLRGHHVIPMPGVFGHEFSGIVAEAGRGVRRFKKGDEIMAVHSAPCLECSYCRRGLHNLCEKIMDTKVLGAFGEYILLPGHIVRQNVFLKPKNLSFAEAAFLEPLSCVVHGMESLRIKKGDKALIFGAGPIGLLHLLLLRSKGADVVISGLEKKRLAFAKRLGAVHAVMPDRLYETACKFTDALGFDCVFECTGQPDVWRSTVDYARRGGTVVLFGGCKSGTTVTYETGRLHYDEITLKGVFHFTPGDVRKAYQLLVSGRIRVSELISGCYSLRHSVKAFERLKNGEGIKYAIIP